MSDHIRPVSSELCGLYHLLRQPRRCYLLLLMAHENPPYDVHGLSKQVAAKLYDTSESDISWDTYKNVVVSMRQTHVPALSGRDVVCVDSECQQLTPGPQFELALLLLHLGRLLWRLEQTTQWSPPDTMTEMAD